MGQQQLLLLVLGIVIVGLAVVTGIQVFRESQKKANIDALMISGMRIATDFQAWLQTPTTLGGGRPSTGGLPDISTITVSLQDLGYPVNGTNQYETVDGNFALSKSGSGIVIVGISSSLGQGGDNNSVAIEVTGVTLDDITTTFSTIPGLD